MSSFTATWFLENDATATGSSAPNAALYVRPGTSFRGAVSFQMGSELSADEQLKIADSILRGVQQWRDQLAEDAQRGRTAEEELAAAREEIARLKAERDGGDDA
ncbi:hypothetical protein ACIOKD_14460 [Streptomyces sp. NPDC087844]|uniref:hypothetical protein n=1 Tax=Streptomyces sp. NPDC087844 TaxID=3365805 RepID=UPI00381E7E17